MTDLDAAPLEPVPKQHTSPPLWLALVLPALAGGMGWGIRGQYGHETGAMIPGLLVALSVALLFCPGATSLTVARIAALTAVGFSFGGSQTYGQTLGLSQDAAIREAGYWWGMLGCFIKGGIWIGLGGAFLGIGLSPKRYRPLEIFVLMCALLAFWFAGIYLLNRPFDIEGKLIPNIYFSDYWNIGQPGWKPRPELWGGLLFALVALIGYLTLFKKDALARNLALIGIPAGGFGFAIGQVIQAYAASHPTECIDPYANWWGFMEVTFGLILGAGLGLGVWLNRDKIHNDSTESDDISLSPAQEFTLLAVQCAGLYVWNLCHYHTLDAVADVALTMGLIPLVAIVGGRYWPYFTVFPILALPIVGRAIPAAVRQYDVFITVGENEAARTVLNTDALTPTLMAALAFLLLALPMLLLIAVLAARRAKPQQPGLTFTRLTIILSVWFYFYLSVIHRDFPWPWKVVNSSTVLECFFVACGLILTVVAVAAHRRPRPNSPQPQIASPPPSPD